MLNILLRFGIHIYWKLFSKRLGKTCIFKESCSHFVYRTSIEKGFLKAIKALKFRYLNCRSGYSFIQINGKEFLITIKSELIDLNEICQNIKINTILIFISLLKLGTL